ncbi:hypothetical protein BLA24_08920 [Streptomyces cinnamoneus]|uniref:Novel STAND NTPase 1 domain-containing protein n=1 Tax=Streptomyces cinnamoneus TaxID=53446 RepID=A0A2G1XMA7_STRCJ|nr:WD40 repeat domain-containing protein [Streptomyces cinnamoneus]PHQ52269.1 hypothetical protein BLA24_08920 [Streptomyces cinnamoneus]PPT12201.1 hypothetical protein CYQ11_04175 [Streptomyces cinnamoneus]
MSEPGDPQSGDEEARQHAAAPGSARIYQAGRDQHIAERDLHLHYQDGVRRARRTAPGTRHGECPYPGLAAFTADQERWFFGRDAMTADLLIRLDERLNGGGPLMVVAPSGAGKSSLLRAGLLPALARGALPAAGSADWPRVLFTPTAHPMTALASSLAEATGVGPQELISALATSPQACVALLRRPPRGPSGGSSQAVRRMVLVIDQLEEAFTLCHSARERRDFLDVLTALAQPCPDGTAPVALVVFGLRADFYAPCADYPQLRTALQNGQIVVGPMTEGDLREAILFPAAAAGLQVEPGLVELLLRDLGAHAQRTTANTPVGQELPGAYDAGRLPLLAHALRATWQQRHGSTLTVDGYQATGGIRHAIATTAESLFTTLDAPGQAAARTLFLRMVMVGDRCEDTRRPASYTDLFIAGGQSRTTAAVIDTFTRGRLLTRQQDTVEISHEALLHAWPRLHRWINTDRAGHITHQNLEQAATEWEHAHRDTDLLYRGTRLETALAWADRAHQDDITTTTGAFLAASTRHERRAARLRRSVIAILAALALIASAAAVIAFQQRATATAQRGTAVFNQVKAQADRLRDSQSSLAAQLDLAAHRMRPDDPDVRTRLIDDANSPLSRPLPGAAGPFNAMVFSPDGRLLAGGRDDGTLQLWRFSDAAHAEPVGHVTSSSRGGPVFSVAFSHHGSLLATANNDGAVRLFDISDPTHPRLLGHTPLTSAATGPAAFSMAFSPDDKTMASASNNKWAQLWDISDPRRPTARGRTPASSQSGFVTAVAFSPNGHTLASRTDEGLQLWDTRNPAAPVSLGYAAGGIAGDNGNVVAFSPDGHTVAAGSADGTVQMWDVSQALHPTSLGRPLIGHLSEVTAVAFSSDGKTLASASTDHTVRLWKLADPAAVKPQERLTGHVTDVRTVAFAPSGSTLVTAGTDKAAQLWDLGHNVLTRDTSITTQAFSPDSQTMTTASQDGVIRRWNISDSNHPALLDSARLSANPDRVTLSPDSHTVAIVDSNHSDIRLWNVTDLRSPKLIGAAPGTSDTKLFFVWMAFSPNGHTFAASDQTGPWLWEITGSAHITLVHRQIAGAGEYGVRELAFSPNGHLLAGLQDGDEGGVRLWRITDPAHPEQLGHAPVRSGLTMAFSPDGNYIATGGEDGTISLWKIADPGRPAATSTFSARTGSVGTIAFSPDGHALTTGGADGAIRLWNVSAPSRPVAFGQPLTSHTGEVSLVAFSPTGRTLFSTGMDGTVRLWDTDINRTIARICDVTKTTLNRQQWQERLPGLPFNPPCA